jgi:hypothetical protein
MARPASDRRTYDAWKPTPPPPRPKRRILGWLGLGVAGLVAMVVALDFASNGVEPTPINPPTTGAAGAPPGASAPRSWRTVVSLSGDSSGRSPVFTLHGVQARLRYRLEDAGGPGTPSAAIHLLEEGADPQRDGGPPRATAKGAGSDDARLSSPAGRYYLYVDATNGHWSVAIQEYR